MPRGDESLISLSALSKDVKYEGMRGRRREGGKKGKRKVKKCKEGIKEEKKTVCGVLCCRHRGKVLVSALVLDGRYVCDVTVSSRDQGRVEELPFLFSLKVRRGAG